MVCTEEKKKKKVEQTLITRQTAQKQLDIE